MTNQLPTIAVGLLGVFLPLLPSCSEDASGSGKVFRFSAIPNVDQKQLAEKYAPVAAYLSDKLGVTVEYVAAVDYPASVTMFVNDDIQMAWFGGFTGVDARRQVDGARAVVKGALDANYKSYFIVSKDSSIEKSDSFPSAGAGKRFTFGSKLSTSGRLMPEFFIREKTGKAPSEFFGEIFFSGGHDKTISLVKDGSWEMGAVDFAVYDARVAEGELDPKDCPVVWESPTYADYQFSVRPGLDARYGAGFTQKLTDALVGMGAELAGKFNRKKMIEASNEDFAGILDVALELKLLK